MHTLRTDHLVTALQYIAGRKCDCAKLAKEPAPCSHEAAKAALVEHDKRVTELARVRRRG